MSDVEIHEGGFVVDAAVLARAFGIPVETVQPMMRDGRITSRCEAGVDEDEGRWRLTFYHEKRACRLTLGEGGEILKRATFDVLARPGR